MGSENTIDTLKAKRQELIKQVEHIDAVLALLGVSVAITAISEKKEPISQPQTSLNYSDYTLKEAVYLYIRNTGRFISTKEIAEGLFEDFGKSDANKFKVQVSALASSLGAEEKLLKYQYGASLKDSVWGLPNWADSNNLPKSEYKPILKQKPSIFDDMT